MCQMAISNIKSIILTEGHKPEFKEEIFNHLIIVNIFNFNHLKFYIKVHLLRV